MSEYKLCRRSCEEFSESALNLVYRVVCSHCGEYAITDAARDIEPTGFAFISCLL